MPELRELQRKLESIAALREIVCAMRNLAAVYVRRAETTLEATRPHSAVVETALATVLDRSTPTQNEDNRATAVAALVFAGDQGLCGTFNEKIVRTAVRFANEYDNATVMVIGARGAELLRQRGIVPALVLGAPSSLEGIKAQVLDIADRTFTTFSDSGAHRLFFLYNRYDGMGKFVETTRRIMPPDPANLGDGDRATFHYDPILTAPPEDLMSRFMEEYFFIELFRALLESHAAENGARLLSMTAASSNIDKQFAETTRLYQDARQDMVTSELLDVVGGAEALNDA